jgi:hypothetical protein
MLRTTPPPTAAAGIRVRAFSLHSTHRVVRFDLDSAANLRTVNLLAYFPKVQEGIRDRQHIILIRNLGKIPPLSGFD